MEIRWLGHASFLITTSDGVRIITDPYESGSYGGGIGYGQIDLEADIVTISHDQHEDHNFTKGIKGDFAVVKGAVKEVIGGVTVRGIASFHDKSQGSERGENTIFCIEADGICLCHLGDLGHMLSGVQVDEIGNADILLIPIGGTYTIDASSKPIAVDFKISESPREEFIGEMSLGIMKFKDDTLMLAVCQPGANDRPTDFEPREGISVAVLRRQE